MRYDDIGSGIVKLQKMSLSNEQYCEVSPYFAAKSDSVSFFPALVPVVCLGSSQIGIHKPTSRRRTKTASARLVAEMISVPLAQLQVQSATISLKGAMKQHRLSLSDLKALPFVTVPNPVRSGFAPMKLFQRADVEKKALEKHGSYEAMEQAKVQAAEDQVSRKARAQELCQVRRHQSDTFFQRNSLRHSK